MKIRTVTHLVLLIIIAQHSSAQDLIVRISDQSTKQPVKNVLIRLHYGCWHSMRPIELKQKTDAAGIAIFRSLSLSPLEFCVFPDAAYASQELPYLFTSPEEAQEYRKSLNEVFTSLPSEVTFHVRRLSFAEQLRNLFHYD